MTSPDREARTSILKSTMELWPVYKLMRFIKNREATGKSLDKVEVRSAYQDKTGFTEKRVYQLMDEAREKEFIWTNNGIELRFEGRELLNGKVGPVSIGLFLAELRIWWLLIILIFGSSSIYGFIHWLIHRL